MKYFYLWAVLITSFIVKVIYVFYFADYKNKLVDITASYWNKAIGIYNGDFFSTLDWTPLATMFYFYLSSIFKVLYLLRLFDYKLEVILVLNVIYSVISVYFLYLILDHLLKRSTLSLIITFLYAFAYPIFSLNALVLSENLFIPILIVSVFFVFKYSENTLNIFLIGILYGLAASFKPLLGLIVFPFILLVIYKRKENFNSMIRCSTFIFGVFLVVFFVIIEVNYISKTSFSLSSLLKRDEIIHAIVTPSIQVQPVKFSKGQIWITDDNKTVFWYNGEFWLPLRDDDNKYPPITSHGPISMKIRFNNPTSSPNIREPLLTTGKVGEGDIVYVEYPSKDKLIFGLDVWGIGGPRSKAVPIDPNKFYMLEVSIGQFFPDIPLNKKYLETIRIKLDNKVILWQPSPFHMTSFEDILVGENKIGGTYSVSMFSGEIKEIKRVGPIND